MAASPLGVDQLLLTKGDNNPVDDLDLYNGLDWLERKHIVGVVRGCVPCLTSTHPASSHLRAQVPSVCRLCDNSDGESAAYTPLLLG